MIAILTAIAVLYAAGYVTGALLLPPSDRPIPASLAVVRLVSGLFLTSTAFLLSLALGVPWFTGPAAALLLPVVRYRRKAFAPPAWPRWIGWDAAAAVAAGVILFAPAMIALFRMAQGPYPPVFYNVDSPYFLEKVHALLHADRLPPPSLSVLGGVFSYHYGVQGIATVIARLSGLLPHQATFAVTLPLLIAGTGAAALVAADALGPAVPRVLSVPLLLIVSPTIWHPYWQHIASALAAVSDTHSVAPLQQVAADYELWGVAALTGQNLASHFLVLAVVGGIAAAPARGWRLPVFLSGCAVLFKAPTGVALIGAFAAVQGWAGLRSRTVRPLLILAAAIGVFAAVYSALWILPRLPASYMTEPYPFFHLRWLQDQGRLPGFLFDLLWLAAPALALITWRRRRTEGQPAGVSPVSIALMALTPLVIVNLLRAIDLRPGRGIDYDWFQIALTVPILGHAAVVAWTGRAWPQLGVSRRILVGGLMLAAVTAPVAVAGGYAGVLLTNPPAGHEFVDNHAIAEALQAIPTSSTVVVTNDLRYPAEGFSRDYRQMQIPALFGHQAFAVNYAYEAYDFSRDRLVLQRLLQGDEWSTEIDAAARQYGWTHLLIRKDYAHPGRIPLERVFDSREYEVYRFAPPLGAGGSGR